jgi:hypothetical protein
VGNIIGEGRSWCTTDVLGKGSCIIGIGGAGSMAVALPLFRFWSGAGLVWQVWLELELDL